MFSYRHGFHAGSHADVLKHMVLIAVLRHLTTKETPITVVDTHAGAGLYRLDSDFAHTSGEARKGILRLTAAPGPGPGKADGTTATPPGAGWDPLIQDYLNCIASFNRTGKLTVYPGSPFIAHRMLRAEARDKLRLFELHPSDSRALAGHLTQLNAGRQVSAARADGFASLKALLPPPSRRALVLIDPSYEIKRDYAAVAACLQDSLKRFATGTYMVWYPIIPRLEAHELPRRLRTLAQQAGRHWLHATLAIGLPPARTGAPAAERQRPGLTASGVFLINPPHTLKADLARALPQLVQCLGQGRGQGHQIESG